MKCETGDLQNAAARAEVCERFPVLEHVLLLLILQLCWEMQVTVEQQMSLCYSPARRNASCQTVFPALCSETVTKPRADPRSLAAFSETCCDRHASSCTGYRVVVFVMELSLESHVSD